MSQRTNRKAKRMSAVPTPRPERHQKNTRKELLRSLARMLEEQMDEMGLTEAEKNERVDALVDDVKKLKTRAAIPSK